MYRKLFILVFSFFAACQGSSSKSDVPHFAYVTNGVASFWTIAEAGARAAGKDLGVKVSVHMPAQGIGDQKRIIEDLLTRGTDGMALSLIDPENQTQLLNQAAQHTNVITHDADAPKSKRLVYVGMDNYKAGRMLGELVKEGMPEGGKLGLFIGRLEQDNARRRRQGFIDEILGRSYDPLRYDPPESKLTKNNFEILATLTDQFDRAKAKANVEDMLARYPDMDAIVGFFAYNPAVALEVLEQAGKINSVKVFAFDEADEVLEAIKNGNCYGTVVQDPFQYGYRSIQVLNELYKGNNDIIPADKFIDIPARSIKSDSVIAFWKDLKNKLAGRSEEEKKSA